ncbi:hypothetical protein, partial [Providencia sp. CIM-Carb-044]
SAVVLDIKGLQANFGLFDEMGTQPQAGDRQSLNHHPDSHYPFPGTPPILTHLKKRGRDAIHREIVRKL